VEVERNKEGLFIISNAHRQALQVTSLQRDHENSLAYALQLALRQLGHETIPRLTLKLKSDIPLGRGFGSGAAVAAALIRALALALGQPLDNDTLNPLVYEVEKKHHGTPSGLDNTVIVYERPIFFVRGQPIETLTIGQPFTLLIGDTGYGTPTSTTVGDVRRLLEAQPARINPILERIGALAHSARHLMQNGPIEGLGALMNENHELLQKLTVSSIELDVLCEAALEAGALGAKMSGGGRGGNMLALVHESHVLRVMSALERAGAARVIKTRLRPPENPAKA
jgi:mevalonate kinase